MQQGDCPFHEGEVVFIHGSEYLGAHIVKSCEWYEPITNPAFKACWHVVCAHVHLPGDGNSYPKRAVSNEPEPYWWGDATKVRKGAPPTIAPRFPAIRVRLLEASERITTNIYFRTVGALKEAGVPESAEQEYIKEATSKGLEHMIATTAKWVTLT